VPRETKAEKALRLVSERRLLVELVGGTTDGRIIARCRGDSDAIYDLGYDPRGPGQGRPAWRCTCEGFRHHPSTPCAHLLALQLVVVAPT